MVGYKLVALTLLALLASACADICGTAIAGMFNDKNYYVKRLDAVVLEPGTQVFDVTVPNDVCSKPPHVGTTLTACDADHAPAVAMFDIGHGKVHRNGAWQYERGMLYTYVVCPY